MRIGGLATGMDTESIIKSMMEANRIPLNKVTQKKQFVEWQLDNYRSTNLDLKKFDDNLFSNMILSDKFRQKIMDVSNPDVLGVKNLNSTGDFSGTITIKELAKNSTMQGGEVEGLGGKALTSTLADLGLVTAGGKTSITINAIGADGKMPAANEDGSEGITLEFNSTDSLQSVLNKINKETGVTAFFDSKEGRIGVSSKNGGTLAKPGDTVDDYRSEIVISGELGTKLKINNEADPSIKVNAGQNAVFNLNGMDMTRSTNNFEVNGFEFTLKAVSPGEVTFSSAPDVDSIVDNVVKFVDEYNKLIESLNDKIREPKYRDFHPLSAEEKADMKEKEIELWEEKAMSGVLRNDPIISSMLSQMRTALMGTVGKDDGMTLKAIGITTSKDYLENGKLVIDEEVLRKAIAEDPDKVHQLFAASDDANVENQGFARRLRGAVQAAETKITDRAGKASSVNNSFTLGKNLIDMDKQIIRFEDRLKMVENRLWKQFTAMEVAIQKANAQSASLMNAFGGA